MKKQIFFNIGLIVTLYLIPSSCSGAVKTQPSAKEEVKESVAIGKVIEITPVSEAVSLVLKPAGDVTPALGIRKKGVFETLDFTISDLEGKQVSLSDFAGKPVILFFWAVWCPFCTEELPHLQKQYTNIKAKGIEVLAIDINDSSERLKKFLSRNNITLPVLMDEKNRVSTAYQVIGIPTYVLINANGKIQFHGNILPDKYLELLAEK